MSTCEHCRLPYTKNSEQQKYCKRRECIKGRDHERNMQQMAARSLLNKDEVKQEKKHRNRRSKKMCSKDCGNTTNNRFGICDDCRNVILQSIDPNYLEMAL